MHVSTHVTNVRVYEQVWGHWGSYMWEDMSECTVHGDVFRPVVTMCRGRQVGEKWEPGKEILEMKSYLSTSPQLMCLESQAINSGFSPLDNKGCHG